MHPIDKYLADEREQRNAQAKAEGWTFWTNWAYDAKELKERYGIETLEQYFAWRDEQDRYEEEKERRKSSW